jgi:hypothetical protein
MTERLDAGTCSALTIADMQEDGRNMSFELPSLHGLRTIFCAGACALPTPELIPLGLCT